MEYQIPKERLVKLVSEFIDSKYGELNLEKFDDEYVWFDENGNPIFSANFHGTLFIPHDLVSDITKFFRFEDNETFDYVIQKIWLEKWGESPERVKIYF